MHDEGRNTDKTREELTSQARCDAARAELLRYNGHGLAGSGQPRILRGQLANQRTEIREDVAPLGRGK
jgi:hypothetical protein